MAVGNRDWSKRESKECVEGSGRDGMGVGSAVQALALFAYMFGK